MLSRGEITVPDLSPHEKLTGLYTIDPVHSTIGHSVRHAMITNVRAEFTAFEGLLKLDGRRPTRSEAYLSVQTGSLETGSPERDAHVTGPDFLDSASFPLMSFRSTEVRDAGDDRFRMAGHLRIKDLELRTAEGHPMTHTAENRTDIAAAVVSLAAEATELETRVDELRQELAHLKERMKAVSTALYQNPPT
ncbi:YceI family protein [Streptomyces mirabilis]|uniref:YceI family protein n=2 Tax=Streptomyces mirabilis TaxID=68239 RepID=UPI00364EBC78